MAIANGIESMVIDAVIIGIPTTRQGTNVAVAATVRGDGDDLDSI